jgi:hypothetical protein
MSEGEPEADPEPDAAPAEGASDAEAADGDADAASDAAADAASDSGSARGSDAASDAGSDRASDAEPSPASGSGRDRAGDASGGGSSRRSLSSQKSSADSESENPDKEAFEDDESLDPEFKRKFSAAKSEFMDLRAYSVQVQRRLLEVIPALGFEDSASGVAVSDFPRRYQEALDRLEARRAELEQTRARNEELLKGLQEQCADADHRRVDREERFLRLREQSGRTSVVSRTNKPVRPTDLNSKESFLAAKNFDLDAARIEFIRTKNAHRQTEDELNKQDQLSEGLHLIDFEQLKIENQALNEKKAAKNQDLVKIEDKIKVNCHMLTHVKEKLAFVRRQKLALHQRQLQMEESYGDARAKLATVRIHRDSVRDENSTLKKSSGLIGMTDLLYDFEHRTNELEGMEERVTDLKTRFGDLLALQRELEAKIAQRQPTNPSLLKLNR